MSSRHKRHVAALRKLYDLGWFVVAAKPAYRTGASEVYVGVHGSPFVRQYFVHATRADHYENRRYLVPPIRTGRTMFVLNRWKATERCAKFLYGWRELAAFAVEESWAEGTA